jgi:transposase
MSEKRDTEQSESSRLESLYRKATDPVLRTHLLMVWRISLGDSIPEVAQMLGYSQKWVTEIARRYNSDGVEGLGDRRHANPGAKERALLDEEGQARLRQALVEEAPPGGGGMWSGPKVARWIERKTGIDKVHNQRGWEYLRKVGYSPQVPRPSNAKGADSQEREAFKKKLPVRLEELKRAYPDAEVQLWAEDEARLGLKPVLRRGVWAPVGKRPVARFKRGYKWTYLYGASCDPRAERFSG